MQLMPGTASDMGVTDRYDVVQNLTGGIRYIGLMLEKWKDKIPLALASYNWGPGNVSKWLSRGANMYSMPAETYNYIKKIVKRAYGIEWDENMESPTGGLGTASISKADMKRSEEKEPGVAKMTLDWATGKSYQDASLAEQAAKVANQKANADIKTYELAKKRKEAGQPVGFTLPSGKQAGITGSSVPGGAVTSGVQTEEQKKFIDAMSRKTSVTGQLEAIHPNKNVFKPSEGVPPVTQDELKKRQVDNKVLDAKQVAKQTEELKKSNEEAANKSAQASMIGATSINTTISKGGSSSVVNNSGGGGDGSSSPGGGALGEFHRLVEGILTGRGI
jgi:hypothetical protein